MVMTQPRTNTIPAKDAGCTCLACRKTMPLPGVVYSPWVQRAKSGTLPAKDMTRGNA